MSILSRSAGILPALFAITAYADTTHISAPTGTGGGTITGGTIEAQISIGDSFEGGVITAGIIQNKGGYTGQLYDPVSLQVTASPTSVNEEATRQLTVSPLMDDDTTLTLAPGDLTWSVLNGPLSGIDANGLATADVVYQDTPADAQASWLGIDGTLTLTVLDSDPDNFGSYAGDQIDDDWQVSYFGFDNPAAAPTIDPDGDEQDNFFEFLAKVDPTDPFSHFTFCLQPTPGQPSKRDVLFFPVFGDRTYTVMVGSDLAPGNFTPLTGSTISNNGSERTVTDNAPATRSFYRIDISK
jgi:hypothetical protein